MQPVEQEGGMDAEGLTVPGATGITAIVMAALSGAALWWERRGRKPRADAEQDADVARARLDEVGLNTQRQMLEMLRQQMQTQQAEIDDLRARAEDQRQRTDAAQQEVLRLRDELTRIQMQLHDSEDKRVIAEATVQQLQARIDLLEAELRKNGIEVPR